MRRPVVAETTALGAAYLAGLAVGYWDGFDDVRSNWALDREFPPAMDAAAARAAVRGLEESGDAIAGLGIVEASTSVEPQAADRLYADGNKSARAQSFFADR